MKKILPIILLVIMATILTACGEEKKECPTPQLNDPNGTIITENILYEETISEISWDSNNVERWD